MIKKNFDKLYAEFYDIIYKDKNYSVEVSELIKLISSYNYYKKKILDFGVVLESTLVISKTILKK